MEKEVERMELLNRFLIKSEDSQSTGHTYPLTEQISQDEPWDKIIKTETNFFQKKKPFNFFNKTG